MTAGNAKPYTGYISLLHPTNLKMHGSVYGMSPPKQDGPPAAAANAGSERAGHCSGVVERFESQKA